MKKLLKLIARFFARLLKKRDQFLKELPSVTVTKYSYNSTPLIYPEWINRHTGSAYFQPAHSQKIKNKRRRAQFQ